MKKVLPLLSLLLLALPGTVRADFAGFFALANWTAISVQSNGSNSSPGGASVTIVGPDDNNFNNDPGEQGIQITMPTAGTISFSYSTISNDLDPTYDYFGYSINGIAVDLATGDVPTTASPSIPVLAGDVFKFYCRSVDNVFGSIDATITNFVHPTPLPVQLRSFTGNQQGQANHLQWVSANERDILHYTIERSADGETYEAIGQTMAENKTENIYQFLDRTPLTTGYYRLLISEMDGSNNYSNVVMLQRKAGTTGVSFYPNPFTAQASLSYTADAAGTAAVRVTDVAGRVVYSATQQAQAGSNTWPLAMPQSMPHGQYMMQLYLNDALHWQGVVNKID